MSAPAVSAAQCAAAYEHPAVRWLLGGELHPGGKALTRRAFELVGLDATDRVLDVGSGDGTTVLLAAGEHGCQSVGVEYGDGAVAEARLRAEEQGLADRVEFVAGDAGSLPFTDAEFDVVLSECSLCVFSDKARAVAEMGRCSPQEAARPSPTSSPRSIVCRTRSGGRWARSRASARRSRRAPTASCSRAPDSGSSPRRTARRTRSRWPTGSRTGCAGPRSSASTG